MQPMQRVKTYIINAIIRSLKSFTCASRIESKANLFVIYIFLVIIMSFIPSREKIMMDRFIKAEEVRKIKKTCHLSKGTNGSNIRIKLEIASERVRSLENSLKSKEKI